MTWFVIAIIFGVVGYQIRIFIKTWHAIDNYKNVFPNNVKSVLTLGETPEGYHRISGGKRKGRSEAWGSIIDSINKYLEKNQGRVSDFNLIKDIVDRNVDAAEDEAREMLPVPLYTGLVGTMAGIIVGLLWLVRSEGLQTLLSSEIENLSDVGVGGLLTDVAIAMVGSLLGVGFTIWSTMRLREANNGDKGKKGRNSFKGVESLKHDFLSWIQAELLPVMSDSYGSSMMLLSREMATFNSRFRGNTEQMRSVVDKVSETTQYQVRLLDAIDRLDIGNVNSASMHLYERLSQSSHQIGRLAEMLESSANYLEQVRALNDRLDQSEGRMKTLEEMGEFFMRERTNVERMERISGEAVEHADKAIERMTNIMEKRLETMSSQLTESLKKQQQVLESKSAEMQKVITEVNNLSGVRQLLSDLNKTTQQQNRILVENAGRNTGLPATTSSLPTWLKVLIGVACSFIIIVAVIILIPYIKDLI
ncbi:MAG: hypothetical protein K6D59_05820 [Bacteroidales bacterium]|nr:hypothetical protein [Bacteroidales bacterium]